MSELLLLKVTFYYNFWSIRFEIRTAQRTASSDTLIWLVDQCSKNEFISYYYIGTYSVCIMPHVCVLYPKVHYYSSVSDIITRHGKWYFFQKYAFWFKIWKILQIKIKKGCQFYQKHLLHNVNQCEVANQLYIKCYIVSVASPGYISTSWAKINRTFGHIVSKMSLSQY